MSRVPRTRPVPPETGHSNDRAQRDLADLLRRLPAIVVAIDERGTITFWNDESERVLGLAAADVVGSADALDRLIPSAPCRSRLLEWCRAQRPDPRPFEVVLHPAAGEPRVFSLSRFVPDGPAPARGVFTLGHDVTDHRRTEHELRESRERLRTAFENVPIDFWVMDADGTYSMVNPAAVRRWGSHVGLRTDDAPVAPEVRELWKRTNARAFAGEVVRGEATYGVKGQERTYEYVVGPIRHPDGTISGILGVNIDITERRAAERAQEQSEKTRGAILEALPDLMFRMSADGRYLDYHAPPGYTLLAPPDRFLGRRAAEVIDRELADLCMSCIRRTLELGGVQHYEYSVGQDPTRHYEVRMTPCGTDDVICLIRNITDIKQTERSLRESEARYRALFESSPLGLFVVQDGRIAMANPATLALLGVDDPAGLVGVEATTIIAKGDLACAAMCMTGVLRDGRSLPCVERLRRADGSEIAVEAAGARIELGGRPAVQITVQDVTRRLRDQESLRESEERFRQIADSVSEVFWMREAGSLRLLYISRAVEGITGRRSEWFYGSPAQWLDLIVPEDRPRVDRTIAAWLAGPDRECTLEYRIARPDGSTRWLMDRSVKITDDQGSLARLAGVAEDVTDRKSAEEALKVADEQLRQSQKMEAVGQLAAGVAHDFNNLLTAIFGYVALARSSIDPASPGSTALDGVQAAAEQASGVIRSLMAVSRKNVAQFRSTDLARVADGALELLRAGLPSTISVVRTPSAEPVIVAADETLLKQVVINLALNARDAMPRGGTIRVSVSPADARGFASLRVEDSGPGIDPRIRARIFEPFFTTKNRETNSGLGLSIAEGIVRSHGGLIDVDSSPEGGASFSVRLPVADRDQPARPAPSTAIVARPARVLVVDPSRQVREIIGSALARAGFGVLHAGGPEDVSREVSRAETPDVAIVNSDPESGAESLRRLRASFPGIRIVALTSDDALEIPPGPPVAILHKPFQVAQMPDLVRRLIDDARTTPAPQKDRAP